MYQDLSYLPDENDFIGGVTALMRLKDTYDLHISSLVDGNFNGVQYDIKLSASDCLEIGKVFYTQDDFLNSVKWFQQAFARADQANPKTTIDVLDYLSFSLYKTGVCYECFTFTSFLHDWLFSVAKNEELLI